MVLAVGFVVAVEGSDLQVLDIAVEFVVVVVGTEPAADTVVAAQAAAEAVEVGLVVAVQSAVAQVLVAGN